MEPTWTVVDRGSQSRGRSLGMLLVLPLLMAIAWCTPGVARHALLTIALTCTFITAHWAVLRLIMDSPLPADLCQRRRRGLITRVAANDTASVLSVREAAAHAIAASRGAVPGLCSRASL